MDGSAARVSHVEGPRYANMDGSAEGVSNVGLKVVPPCVCMRTRAAAQGFVGDVTKEDDVKRVVQESVDKFGKLDVLVNSAGVLQGAAMDVADVRNFDLNMNVNARGVFLFMMEATPHLKAAGSGSIVNVSSVNGMQSFPGSLAYCASKAAVDMMTRCAAVDLATFQIRVNSVNPGVVLTELQKRGGLDEEKYAAFLERSKTVTHPVRQRWSRARQADWSRARQLEF